MGLNPIRRGGPYPGVPIAPNTLPQVFADLGLLPHLEVTLHRGYREVAALMKALVDESFPEAEVIRVVLDNLKLASTGRHTRRSRRRSRGGSRDGWSSMTRRSTTVG
jgi:hypothetical protein